jgi:hypothetical protein
MPHLGKGRQLVRHPGTSWNRATYPNCMSHTSESQTSACRGLAHPKDLLTLYRRVRIARLVPTTSAAFTSVQKHGSDFQSAALPTELPGLGRRDIRNGPRPSQPSARPPNPPRPTPLRVSPWPLSRPLRVFSSGSRRFASAHRTHAGGGPMRPILFALSPFSWW